MADIIAEVIVSNIDTDYLRMCILSGESSSATLADKKQTELEGIRRFVPALESLRDKLDLDFDIFAHKRSWDGQIFLYLGERTYSDRPYMNSRWHTAITTASPLSEQISLDVQSTIAQQFVDAVENYKAENN